MYSMISKILNFISVKISKLLYVVGKDNIPKDSRYVVTCTHESYSEVIMLGMALYPNQIHYVAKKGLFRNKWIDRFLTSLNAFPVDRENPGPSTLERLISLLKDNKTASIFPTGSRTSQEGTPLKRGVSTIAVLSRSPILSIAYVGPIKIYGLITRQAYIDISKPIGISGLPKNLKRNERIDYTIKEIETRMARL